MTEQPAPAATLTTDKQILQSIVIPQSISGGRPRLNRQLAYQLIRGDKSTAYICRVLKCKPRSVRLLRNELRDKGETILDRRTRTGSPSEMELDDECKEVMGYSFHQWLKSKTKCADDLFSFINRTWINLWGKTPLYEIRDPNSPLADQLAQTFLSTFGGDLKRIRRRKKHIRYFFRFFARSDILDRHLSMSTSRDPIEVRIIPELTLIDTPSKVQRAIDQVKATLGEEAALAIQLKMVSQMRTGEQDRELYGIHVQGTTGSYITMNSPTDYAFHVKAKGNEEWDITWLPITIANRLYDLVKSRQAGERLVSISVDRLRNAWKKATVSAGLPPLTLHDVRKISITWLWALGVPLEIASVLNCGWKDLNTARDHYLHYRQILSKDKRHAYTSQIPAWFKEGLDQYSA